MISMLLLDTIINMCTTMRRTFTSYWASSTVREELGGPGTPLREAEMKRVLWNLDHFDKFGTLRSSTK